MQRPNLSRLVILGGSFNPVHVGHVALAEALASVPGVTEVLVIPAAQNPLKDGGTLLPLDVRWEMVCAAFRNVPKAKVLDLELRRGPPSYTFDTVVELRVLYPDTELEIALGWDAFRDFSKWHRATELLELAGLVIVPRAGMTPDAVDSSAILTSLPADWAGRLTPVGPGEWQETGTRDARLRTVVRLLPVRLPEVSATGIWAEKRWNLVPEPARALLLQHLGKGGLILTAATPSSSH